MEEIVLKALKGSIDGKWKGIRWKGEEDKGTDGCDLCTQFYSDNSGEGRLCRGCAVFDRTGVVLCRNTPYIFWNTHHRICHLNQPLQIYPGCKGCISTCDAEIAFLESLLPPEKGEEHGKDKH